jgi:hypothetical protein
VSIVKTTLVVDSKQQDKALAGIERDIIKYKERRERDERSLTNSIAREVRLRTDAEYKAQYDLNQQLKSLRRERENDERMSAQRILNARNAHLETFRQNVASRQPPSYGQSGSLLSRLSGYQRGQLAMQGGDVFTQLAMGQSPLQVAIQQGPQITQILAQTKAAQDGITQASNASATAQAAFAANSKEAAVGIAKSHQSMTLLGASATSLGVIGVAGLVTIGAVYKLTEDIREAAEKRLKTEIAITGEWNRQHSVLSDIAKLREQAASGRQFNTFLERSSLQGLEAEKNRLQAQLDASQKAVTDEQHRRQLLTAKHPGLLPENYVAESAENAGPAYLKPEQTKEIGEKLVQIDARIYAERQRLSDDYHSRVYRQGQSLAELDRAQAVTAIENAKKLAEEMKRLREARNAAFDMSISNAGQGNNFLSFLGRARAEMRNLIETTKDLGPTIQGALIKQFQEANRLTRFGMRIDAGLDADSLRRQASEFRQGFRDNLNDPQTLQRVVDRQLRTLGVSGGSRLGESQWYDMRNGVVDWSSGSGMFRPIRRTVSEQALIDQRLLNIGNGLDPANLRGDQRGVFAGAFEREAERKITMEAKAVNVFDKLLKILDDKGIRVNLDGQATTTVEVKSKDIGVTKQNRSVYGTPISTRDSMEP